MSTSAHPTQAHSAPQQPRLVTYAHSLADIPSLLAAGAEHIIWDDARVSIRSWAPIREDNWDYLSEVVTTVRSSNPKVLLSFNLDGLYKNAQLPLVRLAVTAAATAGFDAIRVMDGGLASMIRQLAPELALELATEMGNCSIPSIEVYANEGFRYQCCSNDWPLEDLRALRQQRPELNIEIMVHGPVLLQYSDRRQLSAYAEPTADPDHLPATDWHTVVIEGRPYPFSDNRHGTIMYNTFDRCLFRYGEHLCNLGLRGWLIDGRGQSSAYTETALQAFAALRAQMIGSGRGDNSPDPEQTQQWLQRLEACSDRPLKPGFFIANNTDRCFEKTVVDQQTFDTLAEVVDVVRKGWMTLIVRQAFDATDQDIEFETPEGRITQLDLSRMTDVYGNSCLQPAEDSVVRLPWTKGAVPVSRLRRATAPSDRDDA